MQVAPLAAIVVAVALGLAGCGGGDDDDSADAGSAVGGGKTTTTTDDESTSATASTAPVTTTSSGSTSTVGPPTSTADTAPASTVQPTTTTTPPESPPPEPEPPGPRPAHLAANPRCEDGRSLVDLSWVAAAGGRPQRVDVTIRPDGFEVGDYKSSETLSGGQRSLVWGEAQGQAIHHWRVVAGPGGDEVVSDVATFEGPSCPVDMQ